MKNEDLFYAMNFLDEDLIDEAKKLDDKAVVTSIEPAKKVRGSIFTTVLLMRVTPVAERHR